MTGQQIIISSRTLVDLLAGRIDQEQFFKDHGSDQFNVRAFFEKRLAEGRMITELGLELREDQDDDWVILRFGEPDPAISLFCAARAGNT